MHKSVTQAVARLQGQLRRTTNVGREAVILEALDILISRPFQSGPPSKLIQRAIDQARRRRRRRARALAKNAHRLEWCVPRAPMAQQHAVFGALLAKAVSIDDQQVLHLAMGGADTDELSRVLGIGAGCARSRLSRARNRMIEVCAE
jgi:hypothetical protein